MDRRDLLKKIGAVAALVGAGAVATTPAQPPTSEVAYFTYKGYRVLWTGWKCQMGSSLIAAQFLATPTTSEGKYDPARPRLFASVPGWEGEYRIGDIFNISPYDNFSMCLREGQSLLELSATEEEKGAAQREGLARLKKVIDDYQSERQP